MSDCLPACDCRGCRVGRRVKERAVRRPASAVPKPKRAAAPKVRSVNGRPGPDPFDPHGKEADLLCQQVLALTQRVRQLQEGTCT